MTTETNEEKKEILFYLNPINWIRFIFSCIMTFVLFINHFFVIILIVVIVSLVAFFSYDRYALMTYDGSVNSSYMGGVFGENEAYKSPLLQGNKSLIRDLSSYYAQQRYATKVKQVEAQKSQSEEKNWSDRPYSSIQKKVRARLKKEK